MHTDRGDVCRAAGRRRARLAARPRRRRRLSSRPTRRSRAGSRSIPHGARRRPRALDRPPLRARRLRLVASRPRDEVRVGVGSFDPRFHVKDTDRAARRATSSAPPVALPGQLDPAQAARRRPRTASSSSATRPGTACPLTAEGIRTALYFGIALRARAARGASTGRQTPRAGARALRRRLRGQALRVRAACCAPSASSAARTRTRCSTTRAAGAASRPRFVTRAFARYGAICPPPGHSPLAAR